MAARSVSRSPPRSIYSYPSPRRGDRLSTAPSLSPTTPPRIWRPCRSSSAGPVMRSTTPPSPAREIRRTPPRDAGDAVRGSPAGPYSLSVRLADRESAVAAAETRVRELEEALQAEREDLRQEQLLMINRVDQLRRAEQALLESLEDAPAGDRGAKAVTRAISYLTNDGKPHRTLQDYIVWKEEQERIWQNDTEAMLRKEVADAALARKGLEMVLDKVKRGAIVEMAVVRQQVEAEVARMTALIKSVLPTATAPVSPNSSSPATPPLVHALLEGCTAMISDLVTEFKKQQAMSVESVKSQATLRARMEDITAECEHLSQALEEARRKLSESVPRHEILGMQAEIDSTQSEVKALRAKVRALEGNASPSQDFSKMINDLEGRVKEAELNQVTMSEKLRMSRKELLELNDLLEEEKRARAAAEKQVKELELERMVGDEAVALIVAKDKKRAALAAWAVSHLAGGLTKGLMQRYYAALLAYSQQSSTREGKGVEAMSNASMCTIPKEKEPTPVVYTPIPTPLTTPLTEPERHDDTDDLSRSGLFSF